MAQYAPEARLNLLRINGSSYTGQAASPHRNIHNEQLKASDQLGWVSRMNSIHQRAEETILNELVFS